MMITANTCKILGMEFKERLEKALEWSGTSQSELARQLKIEPQSVQGWVKGKTQPRPRRIHAIAATLGVRAAWLATGDGEPWETSEKSGSIREPSAPYITELSSIIKHMSPEQRRMWLKIGKTLIEDK